MTARATRAALTLVVGTAVSAGLTATTATSADAAAPCSGKRPTLVSKAKVVQGTLVDDVIVVAGRGTILVDAAGGDDTICVRSPRSAVVTVNPGMGDDVIRVQTRTTVVATLDGGRDLYVGGPGRDEVATGMLGHANRDRVLLRGGDDRVAFVSGTDHRLAVVRGAGGRDEVAIGSDHPLVVDADRAVATAKGRVFARWTGFEDFGLTSDRRQTFRGSERAEKVTFRGAGEVTAATGGGDDEVDLHHDPLWKRPPALDTGPGRDLLRVAVTADHTVGSLVTDRVDLSNSLGHTEGFGFTGVEDLAIVSHEVSMPPTASVVELHGDDGNNDLQGSGCQVSIHGAGGDDRLRAGLDPGDALGPRAPTPAICSHTSRLHGDAGDDELVSLGTSLTPRGPRELAITDLLDGGEGTDHAAAGAGQDTCLAETRVDCEA